MNNLIIPYRSNMGVQTSAPFTNTYSTQFDGVDDYLNLGNGVSFEYTDSFSYSFWLKPNAVSGTKNLYTKYDAGRGLYTYLNSASGAGSNILYFFLFNTNSGSTATRKRITTNTGAIIPPNVWTNIVITYDGSGLGSGINVYKNGISQTVTVTQDNLQNQTIVNTVDSYLCAFNGTSSFFPGGQDEFSIFNTELSSENALAIYGSGQPTDLTDLSPVAWYRMGDNGSYKSPQWLLPSNENKDKVSNYSFQLDGVDDYINCGNPTDLQITGAFTLSVWTKLDSTVGTQACAISKDNGTSERAFTLWSKIVDKPVFYIWNGATSYNVGGTTNIADDTWHHVAVVYVPSTSIRIYVDGVLEGTNTTSIPASINNANYDFKIGEFAGSLFEFKGLMDEVSVFNSAVDIATLYNSGTPTTLPSGAVAHYKMGEEATFSGGVWTVPDSVGSNDGTSNAMTIEDRVGDAPNSENNALSYNMDEVDRVTDTP